MHRTPSLTLFAAATLSPALLIAAAMLWGGAWAVAAPLYLTVLMASLDKLLPFGQFDQTVTVPQKAVHQFCLVLAGVHVVLLAAGVYTLSFNTALDLTEKAMIFFSLGLFFGQVSNANAHELIHAPSRALVALGTAVYASLLFGHHGTAHRLVHHRWVATPLDPNTARRGQSFFAFAVTAWIGSFRKGFIEADKQRRRVQKSVRTHPYVPVIAFEFLLLLTVALALGAKGVIVFIALCAFSQMQLLLSDYVQHYGLTRHILADGRYSPVTRAHAWDAPHLFSGALMLHAPRHADHHMHPSRPFPALQLHGSDQTPRLPYALPVMATLALWPPVWRRVMDRRIDRFHDKLTRGCLDLPPATA